MSGDNLNFSQYGVPGLDDNTTIDVGDYIAFYSGNYNGSDGKVEQYACVTEVSQDEDSYTSYTIEYKDVEEDDVMAAMDLYSTHTKKIELTDEEKKEFESSVEQEIMESNYIETALETMSLMAAESDSLDELNAKLSSSNAVSFALTADNATSTTDVFKALEKLKKDTQWKKDVLKDTKVQVQWLLPGKTHFKEAECIGVQVSLEYEKKLELNEGNELTITIKAEFEQDVLISVNTSGSAIWKKKWIFPYIADYQLNASLDVGTYTGVSLAFGMNTGEKKEEETDKDKDKKKSDQVLFLGTDWSFLWKDTDDKDASETDKFAVNLGKKIDALAKDKEEFLGEGGEDEDDDDILSSMREQYGKLVEDADDAWINLIEKKIFELEGSADPFHVLVYGVSAKFVVKVNAYATLGASFEYSISKRYAFSVLVFERKTTSNAIDLEKPNSNFIFYAMGTLGLRAGVELELAAGIASLKLDKVAITAEAGAYVAVCGYFYYKWDWESGKGSDSVCAGAFHAEIGAYAEIGLEAQAFSSDTLKKEKTLWDNQWPWLTLGERENVYAFNTMLTDDVADGAEGPTYEVESATTLTLPTSLFDMAYMDLQSGELFGEDAGSEAKKKENPAKNYYKDEDTKDVIVDEHFDISLSNDKFDYDSDTNTITITPNGSVEETCEMTLTWKGNSVAFSSKPISMTVTIEWSDLENARYIAFDSQGGSVVDAIAKTAGASITAPANPTKTGYDFGGWYTNAACTEKFDMPTTMPDYSNADKGITVYAKWVPLNDTNYKVEYYEQELNGTYTLTGTETKTAVTDAAVPTSIITTKTGFTLNTKKSTTNQTIAANGSTVVKLYYDREKYTLTFSYGVEGLDDLESQVKYGAEISAPILHRDGYTFKGWDKEIAKTMPAENVTYTAQWQENGTYTITYKGLNGSNTQPTTTSFTASATDATQFTLETPEKNGYTFEKWTCSSNKVIITNGTVTIPAGFEGDITITANWRQNPVQLLYPGGTTKYGELQAGQSLGYTITYLGETSIVAYWLGSDGKHYLDGASGVTGVTTLTAVLMSETTPLEIDSQKQLAEIANNITNSTWASGNYKLVNDSTISLNGWTGIGSMDAPFTGTFDGNSKEVAYGNAQAPLFNYTSGATIKKLSVVAGQIISSAQYVGGIVGYAGAGCTIEDCTVEDATIRATGDGTAYVGGVVGYATGNEDKLNTITISRSNVQNVTITSSSTTQGCYVGGIAGYLINGKVNNETYTVTGCTIKANPASGDAWAGGAVGFSRNSNFSAVTVNNGTIEASSAGNAYSGGIVGELVVDKVVDGTTVYTISDCMVTGGSEYTTCTATTTGTGTVAYAAGVVGRLAFSTGTGSQVTISGLLMNGCTSTATGLTATAAAANVIGRIESDGAAENKVSVSYQTITSASATVNSTSNEELVGVTPDNATKTTGRNSQEITCPAN